MSEKEAQQVEDQHTDDATSADATDSTPNGSDAQTAEIAALKEEAQANLAGWQRSRAEFTNYKRRTQKELSEARERGAFEAIGKFLPLIDDFERALANIPEDLEEHPWMSGTSLILRKFNKVLDEYNIEEVDPVGEEFDPNFHEAVMTEASDDYESGVITATLQKGYRSDEYVIRPALVRVAQ